MSASQLINSFVYLKQTIVTTIIPFLTTLILVRYLSPNDFGVFALSQVYATVLLGVFSLGLIVGYERNYFEYKDYASKHNILFCCVQMAAIILFIVAVAITVGLVDGISHFLNIESGSIVIISTLVGHAFDKLSQYYLIYYRNSENASSYSSIMITQVALNSVISLTAVVFLKMGAISLALGYALSWVIVYVQLTIKWLRANGFQYEWPILYDVVKISIPITPKSLTVIISTQSDKYMLGEFKGVGDVGIYSIAARLGSVVNSFMIAVQNVYVPYLFNHMFSESKEHDDEISSYLEKVIYISIFPAIMIILGAYEVVWILLPEEYSHADIILSLFALYYGIIVFGKITSNQMLYAKKTGVISFMSIAFAIINVLLNIFFIYYYGMVGAVIATLITGGLATLASYILAQRYRYLPWRIKSIYQTLVILFLAISTVVGLEFTAIDYIISVLLRLIIVVLYILIGINAGIISRGSIMYVVQTFRK